MENKITKTLKEWLPEHLPKNAKSSEYELLRDLAEFCREQFAQGKREKADQIVKIISLLYSSGNLHDRNAIENEFLGVLALDEAPSSLKNHMKAFPEKLKTAYIKTILEN